MPLLKTALQEKDLSEDIHNLIEDMDQDIKNCIENKQIYRKTYKQIISLKSD